MTKFPVIAAAAGFALTLGATVPVPQDLRNPFEVADPGRIMQNATPAKEKVDNAAIAREAAFAKVREKLYSLPVLGVVSRMKNSSGGNVTVLLGSYTIMEGTNLPPSDFELNKGILKVTSVTLDRIVIKVSIELETRDITIPLAR